MIAPKPLPVRLTDRRGEPASLGDGRCPLSEPTRIEASRKETTMKDEAPTTSTLPRRALFGLALGAVAGVVLPGAAEAAVVVVRRRPVVVVRPNAVVVRPRRRKVIVVR